MKLAGHAASKGNTKGTQNLSGRKRRRKKKEKEGEEEEKEGEEKEEKRKRRRREPFEDKTADWRILLKQI